MVVTGHGCCLNLKTKMCMMRKKILLAAMLSFPIVLSAQKKVEVRESSENIGGGSHPALSVVAYVKDGDKLLKAFKDKMKDFGAKVSTKKELFADDAEWKAF